ncbi:MAG: ATP-binding protein [Syntrophobacteraceae bacterium]
MKTARRHSLNKKVILCVIAVTGAVLMASIILTVWAGHIVRQVVTDQFNSEQLAVARGAKHFVEREFNNLERELASLARSFSENRPVQPSSSGTDFKIFSHIMKNGVRLVEVVDVEGRQKWVYFPPGRSPTIEPLDESSLPKIPPGFFNEHPLWVSVPLVRGTETYLIVAIPVQGDAPRTVYYHVNISWLLDPYLKSVCSGRTGYAWIIDGNGTFLFHPNTDYVGKNAFQVREDIFPGPYHSKIRMDQPERMLQGLEGSGFYHSNWHRGKTDAIRKLVAHTPIRISSYPPQLWSVAVTAPAHEIEEAIWKNLYWQLIFLGLVVSVLALAAGTIFCLEMRWCRTLENLVQSRTNDLKLSEENYRSLVESAEDFIFTLDMDGCFVSVNSFTARFFGSSPDRLIGQCIYRVFSEEITERFVERVNDVFENGKSVRDEFQLQDSFSPFWIGVNFMPLRDENGHVKAALCIARDITESKKLEKQLISSEKLASLGTLSAGVAHEINNPLGVILGFCDLLLRRKEPGSQEYEDLKIIERQGLYCKEITESLLSFTRLDHSHRGYVDLNECLRDAVRIAQHTLEMNDIHLVREFGADIPQIPGDCRLLQQVFLNLITNAVAAMRGGGQLVIRTRVEKGGRNAIVQVEDNGIGIPPENLEHIFEPFFTTKPEGEGTGLGLFVSYGIVSNTGGTIECHSQTAGAVGDKSGTVFTIMLPTAAGGEL